MRVCVGHAFLLQHILADLIVLGCSCCVFPLTADVCVAHSHVRTSAVGVRSFLCDVLIVNRVSFHCHRVVLLFLMQQLLCFGLMVMLYCFTVYVWYMRMLVCACARINADTNQQNEAFF